MLAKEAERQEYSNLKVKNGYSYCVIGNTRGFSEDSLSGLT